MFIEALVLPDGSLRGGEGRARPASSHLRRTGQAERGLRKGGGRLPSLPPQPSLRSHRCRAGKAQPQPGHAESGSIPSGRGEEPAP